MIKQYMRQHVLPLIKPMDIYNDIYYKSINSYHYYPTIARYTRHEDLRRQYLCKLLWPYLYKDKEGLGKIIHIQDDKDEYINAKNEARSMKLGLPYFRILVRQNRKYTGNKDRFCCYYAPRHTAVFCNTACFGNSILASKYD